MEISGVLERAEHVHGEVSAERNGVDPEWPLLSGTPSQAELAFELIRADRDYRADDRAESWSSFYARRLVEHGWG